MSIEKKWVSLHNHFESSYLDGILRFKDLDKIKNLGFKALSLTDHGNLSGTYEFYKECIKQEIKPIIGIESYYTVQDRTAREPDDLGNSRPNYHMILLAQNKIGFNNLIKLNSRAYSEGFYYSPRIDETLIAEYNEGIIATSACLGSRISQLILHGDKEAAKKLIEHHAAIFKDRYFLELQCHVDQDQIVVNEILLEFSKILNLPIIVTSDSHYLYHEDKSLHDKFLCISTNSKVDDKKRFNFGDLDCHLPTYEEIEKKIKLFKLPEEAISNTNYVANMCTPNYFDNSYNRFPSYKKLPENTNAHDYLEMLVKYKAMEKYNWEKPSKEIRDRIEYELKVIKKMDFSDYMLIRYDTVNYARENEIAVGPGRGSIGGSLVAYLLGITNVDPIKYGLIFERFLNYGRASTPLIF